MRKISETKENLQKMLDEECAANNGKRESAHKAKENNIHDVFVNKSRKKQGTQQC